MGRGEAKIRRMRDALAHRQPDRVPAGEFFNYYPAPRPGGMLLVGAGASHNSEPLSLREREPVTYQFERASFSVTFRQQQGKVGHGGSQLSDGRRREELFVPGMRASMCSLVGHERKSPKKS